MLLFALLSPAHALVALEPCIGFFAADSVPRPAAMDVPIDVVPTVIFVDDGCGTAMDVDLQLFRYDESESTLLGTSNLNLEGAGVILGVFDQLDVVGPLEPLTNYVLRVVPEDGVGEVSAIGFTTGEATLAGLSEVPQLRILSADADKDQGEWTLTSELLIEPAADPDLLSIVTVPHPDEDRLLAAHVVDSGSLFRQFISFIPEDLPKDLCLQVEQFDGAQRPTGLSDAACLDVDKHRSLRGNCSTGGAAAGLGPALLALLLARRAR